MRPAYGARLQAFSPSSMRISSHSDELVADPAHAQQALRGSRLALDLAAEVGNVRVTRSLVANERAAPQELHELTTGVDPVGVLREVGEELELGRRQLDLLALHGRLVAQQVDLEPADEAALAHVAAVEVASPEKRPHAADELRHRERLRH